MGAIQMRLLVQGSQLIFLTFPLKEKALGSFLSSLSLDLQACGDLGHQSP